jgi:deuterolysin
MLRIRTGVEVAFQGVQLRYSFEDLPEDAFTTLEPGEAFTSVIDIAPLHELSEGDYTVSTVGAIPYATLGTTEISSAVSYKSNVLDLTVSGSDIGLVPRAVPFLDSRATPQGCSGSQEAEFSLALQHVVGLATFAALEARFGDARRFDQFFHSFDEAARNAVSARFDSIAREANVASRGSTNFQCTDAFGFCDSNTLSYSIPSQNLVGNCPLYYTLASLSWTCGGQDQTGTTLHEMSHLPSVSNPVTQDFAFGAAASSQLSPEQAILNADTYVFYANCKSKSGQSHSSYDIHADISVSRHLAVLNGC